MPEQIYLFQKINQNFISRFMRKFKFLYAVFCLFPVFAGCRAEPPSVLSASQLDNILETSVSADNIPLKSITEIDPYDSFFLALKAYQNGFIEAALKLSQHCRENTSGFISAKAAELLISINMEIGEYAEAEFQASRAAAEYSDKYIFKRMILESAYWQHEDKYVFESLPELAGFTESSGDYELFLFKAVSAYRLGLDDWKTFWVELFLNVPASDYLRRGWDYLHLDYEDPSSEFPELKNLIEGKYLLSIGRVWKAAEYLGKFAENADPDMMNGIIINDIEKAFIRAGRRADGAALFEKISTQADDPFMFAAARMYRRAGMYRAADRCMDKLIAGRGERKLLDRELWYSFDIKSHRNLGETMGYFDFYSSHWEEPEFFSDTIDNFCTTLVRNRRWRDIRELALKLEKTGPVSAYERFRYITETVAELKFIEPVNFSKPFTGLYYSLLSGHTPSLFKKSDRTVEYVYVPSNDEERYIGGFIRYDLDNLLDEVKKYRKYLSEGFFVLCAEEAVERGHNLDSIRIMYQFEGELSLAGYSALYPDLYSKQIETAARKNNVPVQLLFGLVWKESGFEREIVSRSGAVGLSQLMPSTAEDVARRNRRSVGDLTNPADNLFLGSWYLNWLNTYVGNTAAAVLSYNGGPGRVKRWIREYADLPMPLIYEVIPVAETHQYGKKVLTAAVLYGYIYYGIKPEQTLGLFF